MQEQSSKKVVRKNKVAKTVSDDGLGALPLDLRLDKSIYEKYCIESQFTDKKGFKITLELLEKIWNQSLNVDKEPHLIIGIRRNDDELFMIHCAITTQRDKKES